MLAWRVQQAAGGVASRCVTRLAHTRLMATLQGSNTVVQQGKLKVNDNEFIAYRYTAPTAADKPCVVFLHGEHSNKHEDDASQCVHGTHEQHSQTLLENYHTDTLVFTVTSIT